MLSYSSKYIFRVVFLFVLLLVGLASEAINYSDSIRKYTALGNYEKAKELLIQSKSAGLVNNDSLYVIWLIEHSGITSVLGENDSALLSLENAESLSLKNNFEFLSIRTKIQQIEFSRKLRKYGQSRNLLKQTLEIGIKDSSLLCRLYHRAAAVYNEINSVNGNLKTLDTALNYSLKALEIAKAKNNVPAQALCLNELGNIYHKKQDLLNSYKNYHQSIQLWEGVDVYNQSNALMNLGYYFQSQNSNDSAIFYFNKALFLVKNSEQFEQISSIYRGLKLSYFNLGDSLNALKNHVQEVHNTSLGDRKLVDTKTKQLALELDTKKKEQEISKQRSELKVKDRQYKSFLFSIIAIIIMLLIVSYGFYITKKKNLLLKKLINENQFLIGETNHRIKNNLQLIISLIGREMHKYKGEVASLEKLSVKINSIASLHQQLYLNESIKEISVKEYVKNIYENMQETMTLNDFDFEMEVEEINLAADKAIYLGLLITELITNTIKHAYFDHEEKFIGLNIHQLEKKVVLKYFDSGKGVKKDTKLRLVSLLIKQLAAELIPYRPNEKGYSIQIKF